MEKPVDAGFSPRGYRLTVSGAGQWKPPRRWVFALCAVTLVVGAYLGYRTTVPYDPLAAAPQGANAALGGVEPGKTYTAIVPLQTPSAERATLINATPASNTGARFISVTGVIANPGAYIVRPGGAHVAAAQLDSPAMLRPISGLRFSPPTADAIWTHAWIAVTFRMERSGCVDLPKLRLRYAVGSTEFTRVVPLSLQVASGRTPQATNSCL